MSTEKEQLIKTDEIAAKYPISRPTIFRNIKNGRFPQPISPGSKIFKWKRSEIEEFFKDAKPRRPYVRKGSKS